MLSLFLLFLHAGLQRLSAGSHADLWNSGILGKHAFVCQTGLFLFLLPLSLFVLCLICSDTPGVKLKQSVQHLSTFQPLARTFCIRSQQPEVCSCVRLGGGSSHGVSSSSRRSSSGCSTGCSDGAVEASIPAGVTIFLPLCLPQLSL